MRGTADGLPGRSSRRGRAQMPGSIDAHRCECGHLDPRTPVLARRPAGRGRSRSASGGRRGVPGAIRPSERTASVVLDVRRPIAQSRWGKGGRNLRLAGLPHLVGPRLERGVRPGQADVSGPRPLGDRRPLMPARPGAPMASGKRHRGPRPDRRHVPPLAAVIAVGRRTEARNAARRPAAAQGRNAALSPVWSATGSTRRHGPPTRWAGPCWSMRSGWVPAPSTSRWVEAPRPPSDTSCLSNRPELPPQLLLRSAQGRGGEPFGMAGRRAGIGPWALVQRRGGKAETEGGQTGVTEERKVLLKD